MRIARTIVPLLVIFVAVAACSIQDTYRANVSIETKFTALAEKYEIWYQAADQETKNRWKANVDPMFKHADMLLDRYNSLLKSGGDAATVAAEIDLIITEILIQIAKERTGDTL